MLKTSITSGMVGTASGEVANCVENIIESVSNWISPLDRSDDRIESDKITKRLK